MKNKLYVFGMNYNPILKEDEPDHTEIKIPAKTEEEANARLVELVGRVMAKRFILDDTRDC